MAGKLNILIVEDNREFAAILRDFLEARPEFDVVGVANDGLEAISYIKDISIDLILLDLIMPKLDGIGVLEELNTMNLKRRPKIAVLSAVGNDNFTYKALKLGADYYMVKPFDMDVLSKRIIDLFQETQPKNVFSNEVQSKSGYEATDPEVEISQFLHRMGVPPHIKGYQYLKEAVCMVLKDMTLLSSLTTILYPEIGKKYNTTSSRVERAIRHGIETASVRDKSEAGGKLFQSIFMNKKGKPTNGEFIGVAADSIRLKLKNQN